MRPKDLKTKIFVDGSDITQTKTLLRAMGFLDGQTTNPTNFGKSPEVQARIDKGEKFTKAEIYQAYKNRVQEISKLMPNGSVSIEVYADATTTADEMFKQGKEMFYWIPNAHIKYPTTAEGLKAAEHSVKEGMRVNMTLVFSQEQAAAVYAATIGAKRGDVFVSPFVGRLDDRGENGLDLIKNILKMYKSGDGHVEVLTASIRTVEQFTHAIALGTDIITSYFVAVKDWADQGMPTPPLSEFGKSDLKEIAYQEIDLNKSWLEFDIKHDLTDSGLKRFADDWNALIQ